MTSPRIMKAQLLLQQGRHALAEAELMLALADHPEDPTSFALLAMALAGQDRLEPATEAARQAIGLAPTYDYAHYALATVLEDRNRYDEAEAAICEAIRLDPEDADYHAALAGLRSHQRQWPSALEAVDVALALDPEHGRALNIRAFVLTQLGRRDEAGATIAIALARNPEDGLAHANLGWSLLHESRPAEAMEHFREALRLEPELGWARQGMVQAMQARNVVYRQLLRYFLWMSRLSDGAQWGLILGAWLLVRVLGRVARANPAVAPFVVPIVVLYLLVVFLTWTGPSLANLMLRLHPMGRHALSRDQRVGSTWVGLSLLVALICGIAGVFALPVLLLGTVLFLMLVIPISATYLMCAAGWPRTVMAWVTLAILGFGVAGLVCLGVGRDNPGNALLGSALLGAMLSSFAAGWLGNVTVKR